MNLLTIPLGGFHLHRMIGLGGSGEVWQGKHVATGVPVAVKVITAQRARDPHYREAFRNEVAAVAGLDHPGVVMVFDYGEVDKVAEKASLGRMVAGSPYLAMELAHSGSLATAPPSSSWDTLRVRLVWLLDVLAHAHAMGVIHRDLKPGNVLLFDAPAIPGDETEASRLRLTDFGLAHAIERQEDQDTGVSGTPSFMAPEQFRGHWRDFGPWTDLYSFGCMAYTLATGGTPYQSRSLYSLMQDHLSAPVPPLRALHAVPREFESWIRRLMHKDPEQRFQRAADAAFALLQMPDPSETPRPRTPRPQPRPVAEERRKTVFVGQTIQRTIQNATPVLTTPRKAPVRAPAPGTVALAARTIPPVAESWQRSSMKRPTLELIGVGLGLFGLRALPLVARNDERDAIWSALKTVGDSGGTQALVLTGAAGVGKSRLAEWAARRADELGNGFVLKVSHDAAGGNDGLPKMLVSALCGRRMNRSELLQRLRAWHERRGITDPYEWNGLLALMWPARPDDSLEGLVRFGSADERYALMKRFLARLATPPDANRHRRPVVLWLDDVQWGSDALGFASYLLRTSSPGSAPFLLLLTAREEALAKRPREAQQLTRLWEHEACTQLPIGPLSSSDNRELIRALLHLRGELAEQVEERTSGNPLFAVQLVGDWVERGVLEVSEDGFQLRAGAGAPIPDDIHALWARRLRDALGSRAAQALEALEIGALLGSEVENTEWIAACRVAGLELPDDLLDTLTTRRLLRSEEAGTWTFVHGMLRESLERNARERGVAKRLHLACATVLEIRYDVASKAGIAERLGRHLFYGGRPERALGHIRRGAGERRATSDYASTMQLIELEEEILTTLDLDPADRRWGLGWVSKADLLIGQGKLDEAEEIALATVESAIAHGWDRLKATALRHAASVAAKRGDLALAAKRLTMAERSARAASSENEIARVLLFLGEVTRLRGDHEEAERLCQSALKRFTLLEDLRGQADTFAGLAHVYRAMGNLDETEKTIRECIPLFERVGARFGIGAAQNTLGEVLRARGSLQQAAESYREAEQLLRSIGSPEHFVPLLNLGLVQVARREFPEAHRAFNEVLTTMVQTGRRGLEGALRSFLLPCLVAAGETDSFEIMAEEAAVCLADTGFVDADIAEALELAATLAMEQQQPELASAALRLAETQWVGLKQEARLQIVREKLQDLEPSTEFPQ